MPPGLVTLLSLYPTISGSLSHHQHSRPDLGRPPALVSDSLDRRNIIDWFNFGQAWTLQVCPCTCGISPTYFEEVLKRSPGVKCVNKCVEVLLATCEHLRTRVYRAEKEDETVENLCIKCNQTGEYDGLGRWRTWTVSRLSCTHYDKSVFTVCAKLSSEGTAASLKRHCEIVIDDLLAVLQMIHVCQIISFLWS